MRLREPLLGGSAAMPGASLQRACRLLVAVCALHLGVTLLYYLAGRDLGRLPRLIGVPTPVQQGSSSAAASGQPPGEPQPREPQPGGARPPPPPRVSAQPRPGRDPGPGADSEPGPASNLTSVRVAPATALPLPACPEESPRLGKDSACALRGRASPRFSATMARASPSRPHGCSSLFRVTVPNPREARAGAPEGLGGVVLEAGAPTPREAVWSPLAIGTREGRGDLPALGQEVLEFGAA